MPDTSATPPSPRSSADTVAAAATRSRQAYQSSQTFIARTPDPRIVMLRITATAFFLLLFFIAIPALNAAHLIEDYKVSLLGKYLSMAIAAIGIDLIWGYTGLLSLCQAMFFCMGAYAMGMHMSLPSGGGDVRAVDHFLPQFLSFNNMTSLPWFWKPFSSTSFTIVAAIALPAIAAGIFGFFVFRSRVRGVYFSIVTQAVAFGAWQLIQRNEMLLGGTNGLTNFYKPYTQRHGWILTWYLTTLTILVICYLACFFLVKSRLGRVLIAVRDKETRLYFAGYRPYAFKVFAFAFAGALAGIGGMLYTPQFTIITPQNMNVEASILMVIWVAVGGRGRLWGAILGAMLINYFYSSLTSDFSGAWLYIEGAIFILVPLFLPDGLVGLWSAFERQFASGAPVTTMFFTILPLLTLVLFVLGEALGMTPAFLQRPADGVGLKYIAVLLLLVASAVYYFYLQYCQRVTASALQPIVPAGAEAA